MRVTFSGDIGYRGREVMPDPVDPHPCDLVVSEATYGDRPHRSVEESRREFEQAVKEAIARGGNVLIPSFALERSQDVLYYLHLMWDAGELSRCRIFLDSPLAVSITKTYERHLKALNPRLLTKLHAGENPFEFPGVEFTVSTEDSKAIQRWPSGSIIIAGSGMANGGRILHHLRHNLWRRECSVIFVGYQAIGTPGRAIVDGARSIRVFGEEIAVRARVYTINGLSAHADQRGLVDWLRGTKKADVLLVHGEQKSLKQLAAVIHTELARTVSVAVTGNSYEV
jgi:metallo-beta-lactamase family protein